MAGTQQYWDGERWTEHVAPATPTTAHPEPSPAEVSANKLRFDASERRLNRWSNAALVGVFFFAPLALVAGLVLWAGGRVRTGVIYTVLSAVWLAVVAGIVVDRWPSRHGQIDQTGVQNSIQDWARDNGATNPEVTCPGNIDIEAGRQFHCILTDAEGESLGVEVTIENTDGYVTWQVG